MASQPQKSDASRSSSFGEGATFKTSTMRASHIRNLFFWEAAPQWNSDTVVLITGGGSGIGRQVARIYASRNAKIVLCDISQESLVDAVRECRSISTRVMPSLTAPKSVPSVIPPEEYESFLMDTSENGKGIIGVRTDVTNYDQCKKFVNAAVSAFHRIDILILCAGVGAHNIFRDTLDLGIFHKCMNINFFGYLNCTRAAHEHLLASKGTLTAITSFSAEVGLPYRSAYCSSKFAVTGFLESLRAEMKDLGGPAYDIVLVCPPTVDTNLRKNSLTTDQRLTSTYAKKDDKVDGKNNNASGGGDEGENDKAMTVEDCASCVVDATDRRLRKAFFPFKSALASYLRPLFPDLIDKKIWEKSRL